MRLTKTLYKQNIGWHFKLFWASHRKRVIQDSGAEKILKKNNIPIFKPEDILIEKREFQKIDIIGSKPKPVIYDKTHPNWHDEPLLTYKDNNLLLEGLTQAKILTKTVELTNGLPDHYELKTTDYLDARVKDIIRATHVFDGEQKKLPKVKDPARPAWRFPRTYGITQERINKLLLARLIHLIESTNNFDLVKERYLIDNLLFAYNYKKYDKPIQYELKIDTLLTSLKLLPPATDEDTENSPLPDISPIIPTITLTPENIYEIQNLYPIKNGRNKPQPHTLFVHYNKQEVRNLYEEEVTEEQIYGRSLLKAFTVAAAYATANPSIPKPITVQLVQTDGRLFHFGVFQLNTLDLDSDDGVKNVWYQTKQIPLFENCCYKSGKPILENYNNKVIGYLNAFYNRT